MQGNFDFDAIVVGGGHAGVEASMALAHLHKKTLLITLDRTMIANTPCNPHIGGSAKGIVVREIDALGGMMGLFADYDPLQIKFLNTRKGPGVQCLRAQVDKKGYPKHVQEELAKEKNLEILEGMVTSLLYDEEKVYGVILENKRKITAKAVILTTGTYMESSIISGNNTYLGGPDGQKASIGLSASLEKMGIKIRRLKTGTPPRIAKETIDFSKAKREEGMEGELAFSYLTHRYISLEEQLPCYLIYTTPETRSLIMENLSLSAVTNGLIQAAGPRYCPSIESKMVRFPDKERHQLFLEPEFKDGNSIYLQGFSTGFPHEMQEKLVHTLPGLEKAKILKDAYQIEYDCLASFEFDSTLKVKKYAGLYVAGQICGTSGYEEAAGLGLMAGINASLAIDNKEPFILRRDEAYIGVMIDDLVSKGAEEPYRLLSSRAEYRLLLRHDNADFRLTEKGHEIGIVSEERYSSFLNRKEKIAKAQQILTISLLSPKCGINDYLLSKGYSDISIGHKAIDLLKRPFIEIEEIKKYLPELVALSLDDQDDLTLETGIKYSGYIALAKKDAETEKKRESLLLPDDLDYKHMDGLRLEARERLAKVQPKNIGQASRIYGVNPTDISILLLHLKKRGLL